MSQLSYAAILHDSESARWSLDEATANLIDLDFERPFLPEPLVHAGRLPYLTEAECVLLSQLRGRSYLGLAVLAEKIIAPFVMSEAARHLHGDIERFLALMGFGERSAKHTAVFERYAAACEVGFDTDFALIGPAEDINARFLTNHTMAVGLLVLHLECATQTHYVRATRGAELFAEQFKELLRLHWREGAQNARLCSLLLTELANDTSQHERERAVQGYLGILDDLSAALKEQVEFDLVAFQNAGRPLTEDEKSLWRQAQHESYVEVFLRHGIEHKLVKTTMTSDFSASPRQLNDIARRFSVTVTNQGGS